MERTPPRPTRRPIALESPVDLIIFDFDGTLFDTHASIAHCIARTFAVLAPDSSQPSSEDIQATISSGAGLEETFRRLLPKSEAKQKQTSLSTGGSVDGPVDSLVEVDPGSNEDGKGEVTARHMADWTAMYRTIYSSEGLSKINTFPGAKQTLEILHRHSIPLVVSSNKGTEAILSVLKVWDMLKYIDFVAGDMPGVKRKPDPESYHKLIVPKFGKGETVYVIGDTLVDIQYARNIGAISVWAKYGYGKMEDVHSINPLYTIECLSDLVEE